MVSHGGKRAAWKLLFVKTIRDMRRSAVAYGTSILIVAIGFCGYCVLAITSDQLTSAKEEFFASTAFPQVFVQVQEAPAALSGRLERLNGIERAEGRLTQSVRVTGLGDEHIELKLTSIVPDGLCLPLYSKGTAPADGAREIAVGDGFFDAHKLQVGDMLEPVISGRKTNLTVTGSGITPENIYMIRSMTDMLPDFATYDTGFVSYDTLSALLSKQGLVNEFVLTLSPGYTTKDVEDSIRRVLEPYGCYSVFDREDHLSVAMLLEELKQLERMSTAVPFLFLIVASVILYITLHRLIQQQRTQAGTLMALGFYHRVISRHYVCYGALVGLVGGFLGGLAGSLLAKPMGDFYGMYFKLPQIPFQLSPHYMLLGSAAAAIFCGGVGWVCARSLSRLSPSEALRPAAPKHSRPSVLERIPGFTTLFTVPGLMAVRSLSRNRKRTAMSLFGIACAYMITASLVSMNSLFDVFLFDFLEKTQRQDISVHFSSPVAPADAMRAIRDPAVELVEGIVEFPSTLEGPGGKIECTIQGIPQDSQLCRLYNEADGSVTVTDSGIVLSRHMANRLGVGKGDMIQVKTSYPREQTTQVAVADIIAQYMGSTAYTSHQQAGRLSDYGSGYTSVLIKAPDNTITGILEHLEDATAVTTVESRMEKLQKYRTMMGSFGGIMVSMAGMGVLIGLAVVYTSSLISFEELKREISTMMMLGLTHRQCLDVISTGQWLLSLGAVVLGIPMTMAASRLMSTAMVSELYTIPDFVDLPSLLFSILLTFAAVWLSSALMLRKLKKLTPAELLRERE